METSEPDAPIGGFPAHAIKGEVPWGPIAAFARVLHNYTSCGSQEHNQPQHSHSSYPEHLPQVISLLHVGNRLPYSFQYELLHTFLPG
jgi:hypothetical protein